MSQELNKNNWQPTAKIEALRTRAESYRQIRDFFADREVLEVETPLVCARSVTDPYLHAFMVEDRYLQTSPEYAMKRMLASGYGSIYQICKVFRQDEVGRFHNPEFTMLEWYRPGFDHVMLMNETDLLMQTVLGSKQPARKITYLELFQSMVDLNPHTADLDTLQACATKHNINLTSAAMAGLTVTDWLQIIMSHVIEPQLTGPVPWIVYDFPAAQAALSKIIHAEYPVAARFEVYMQGIELANGYHELQDPNEQSKRFAADNLKRSQQGVKNIQADERLLAALEYGLPDCAGIAMGLDRLIMLKLQAKSIADVISFTADYA